MAPFLLPSPQHLGIGFHLKDYLKKKKKTLTSVSESNQAELPAQEIVK